MPRRPDAVCAGTCGRLIWGGRDALPPGQRKCRECRTRECENRNCQVCGRAMVAVRHNGHRRTTCSDECLYAARTHGGPKPPATCEVCAKPYRRTYPQQRTCGRDCGWELRRTIATIDRTCRQCRQTFTVPSASCLTSTCGPVCPAAPAKTKTCDVCHGEFVGQGKSCSPTCAAEAKRRYAQAYNKTRPRYVELRFCSCGAPTPSRRRFKCDKCLAEARKRRRRNEKARVKYRDRGLKTEPYTLGEIAQRDGYRCQIPGCVFRSRLVPMDKAVPHPKAPTIDHVIPRAHGGDDTKANVQLAHFQCNWTKSDRDVQQQLALIG